MTRRLPGTDPRVPAADSCLQLQRLTAAGYILRYLVAEGVASEDALRSIRSGRQPTVETRVRDAIAYTYSHLRNITPADVGISDRSAHLGHLMAARNGWTTEPVSEDA